MVGAEMMNRAFEVYIIPHASDLSRWSPRAVCPPRLQRTQQTLGSFRESYRVQYEGIQENTERRLVGFCGQRSSFTDTYDVCPPITPVPVLNPLLEIFSVTAIERTGNLAFRKEPGMNSFDT